MAKKKKPAPVSKAKVRKKTPPARPSIKSSAKKPIPKKSVKPAPKKPSKPTPKPPAKPAAKGKPAKPTAPVKSVAAPAAKGKPAPANGKNQARALLRNRILGKAKPTKPIAFSLDEVREIAKTVVEKSEPAGHTLKPAKAKLNAAIEMAVKTVKPHHVKAASLADVLGFNPNQSSRRSRHDDASIPEKYRRYYKLLVELRNHVTGQLDQHTEETLKRSSKEDSGDLSSYGQHMADAGTDTFDRDFALSLVSNEQEALSEIEAAIQRIKAGTYGICEVTQQPIAKERLLAVPFTRYSTEAQKELERNRHRSRTQAGLFGEHGEEGAKIADDSDDE